MKQFVQRTKRWLFVGVCFSVRFLCGAVGFLAACARTTYADNVLNSSIRGGVLNYRTGKLDDGTDPYGWYEKD
jgi:hypothetical protein